MADRERLEAELRARWTPENLAVYADFLQAEGDPRGELILVGQRLAVADDVELRAHRDRLLDQLGVPKSCRHLVKTGFVPTVPSYALELLDTPVGELARSVELIGSCTTVLEQLRRVAAAPRPLLDQLELGITSRDEVDAAMAEIIPNVIARAAHLRRLEIHRTWLPGWSVARELVALAVDLDVLLSLARTDEVLPGVTELEIKLPRAYIDEYAMLASSSHTRQLPALRRLVIGRGQTAPHVHATVFRWLARTELVRHLDELVVPAPRSPEDARNLAQVRKRFAGRLEVVRAYAWYPLAIDGVVVPPLRPWPPPDELAARKLRFVVGTGSAHFTPDEIDHASLVITLEQLADRGPFALAPWARFYEALGRPLRTAQIALAILLDAIATLPDDVGGDIGAFAARIRELPAELRAIATVQVTVLGG